MTRSTLPALLAVLATALLAGCQALLPESRVNITVTLNVQGTVSSAVSGAAIEGATVTLGLTPPTGGQTVRQTTQTNATGAYAIQNQLKFENSCPLLWVKAEAPGYVTSSIDNEQVVVVCTGLTQSINIALQPVP